MEEQQTARQTQYTTKPYIRGHKNLLFNNQNNYYDFHKDEFQQLNCKQFFFFFKMCCYVQSNLLLGYLQALISSIQQMD